jgi:gliding motility-associated-like protein
MYLSCANGNRYFVNNLQVLFSETLINNQVDSVLQIPPQLSLTFIYDTLNWLKISAEYVATGTENYLIIGNFFTDQTINCVLLNPNEMLAESYIYIDDLSLRKCSDVTTSLNLPNVFTPNGDQINDAYVIPQKGFTEITVQIFDRWGILIYAYDATTDYWRGKDFNGNEVTEGVYFATATGRTKQGETITKQQFVSVMR